GAGGVVLGEQIGSQDKGKSPIRGRREPIFLASKPMHSRVRVARVKRVVYGRLERFVMCRHRSILQTARDINPPEPVFMRDERRVARNTIQRAHGSGWS